MKEALKQVLSLKVILHCYISASGYGLGYYLPAKFGWPTLLCIFCCLVLGSLFDNLGNKLLSTNFFNGSLVNKITVVSFVYWGYLAVWMLINKLVLYDLDYDFISEILFTIIIQIVLVFVKYVKEIIQMKRN